MMRKEEEEEPSLRDLWPAAAFWLAWARFVLLPLASACGVGVCCIALLVDKCAVSQLTEPPKGPPARYGRAVRIAAAARRAEGDAAPLRLRPCVL